MIREGLIGRRLASRGEALRGCALRERLLYA